MSGACEKSDERSKASPPQARGLQRPPTTLPTCYHRSRYLPGCAVLECRLEADRPLARVVQVLADTATIARNPYPLVETESTTSSRVKPRLADVKRQAVLTEACSQGRVIEVMPITASNVLESQECIDTSIDEIPLKIDSVATLETGKDGEQSEDTVSKTSYRSTQKPLWVSHRDETSRNHSVTFIECTATPKGPSARIIQCPTNETIQLSCVKKHPNCLEASVWFGDKCTADTQRPPIRYSFDQRESRARIISSGDKIAQKSTDSAIAISDQRIKTDPKRQQTPSGRSKSAIPRKHKPKAIKYTHQPDPDIVISLSPEMKVSPCPRATCKNGLDSAELPESSKRSLGDQVCLTVRHQPSEDSTSLRSVTEEVREDSSPIEARLTPSICPGDQRGLRRPTSEQMLGAEAARLESAKSNKASACRRSATASGRLIPQRVPEDTSRSLGSQEPLARHEVYIPEYQLERYEARRSKKNGLQDECVTPFLWALTAGTEQQRKSTLEKCIERERDIDKLDREQKIKLTCSQRDQRTRIVLFCLG